MTASPQPITAQPFRFPDKPGVTLPFGGLASLPDGDYLAELKFDGWRTLIQVGPKVGHAGTFADGPDVFSYTSQHGKDIPIEEDCRLIFEQHVVDLGVPAGTLLDGEWLSRRPGARAEALHVFDIMRWGLPGEDGIEFWQRPARERLKFLVELALRDYTGMAPYLVPFAENGYTRFFDNMREKHGDIAEGIVLKKINSPYIGALRKCADNSGWIRCKWRAGHDGCTRL